MNNVPTDMSVQTEVSEKKLFCAFCSAPLRAENKFCPVCGGKAPVAEVIPEPMPKAEAIMPEGAQQPQIPPQVVVQPYYQSIPETQSAPQPTPVAEVIPEPMPKAEAIMPEGAQQPQIPPQVVVQPYYQPAQQNAVPVPYTTAPPAVITENKPFNKKLFIPIIAGSSALVLIITAVFIFLGVRNSNAKKEYNRVISAFEMSDFNLAVKEYEGMSSYARKKYEDKIIEEFAKIVCDNPYSSNGDIISEYGIQKYKKYRIFADAVDLRNSEYPRIRTYIDDVVSLEKYLKYEELINCSVATLDDTSTATDYLSDASDSYYKSIRESYFYLASDYFEYAYDTSLEYDSSEYGVRDFQETLGNLEYYTYKLYLNGNSSFYLSELTDAMNAYSRIIEELTDVITEIKEIEEDIENPPYSFDDSDDSVDIAVDDTVYVY